MRIEGIIWLRDIVDKLVSKHHVETSEVEQVLNSKPKIRFVEKGDREGEDVYLALDELVEFFETQDLGEYRDQMPEAHFDIDIKRRTHIFAIDEDLANRLTEVAKAKRIPSETLINIWLREKLLEQRKEFP